MTEVSVNLEKLRDLAAEFGDLATDTSMPEWAEQTKIAGIAWPTWMAADLPERYANLQEQFAEAVETIRSVTSTIEEALQEVADYYEKNETESGADADAIDAD